MLLEAQINTQVRANDNRLLQLHEAQGKQGDLDEQIQTTYDELLDLLNQLPEYVIRDRWPALHEHFTDLGHEFTMCGRFENSFEFE